LKRRDGERQHPDQADAAKRSGLGQRLDQKPAPPPGDVKTVHEVRKALEQFPAPAAALKEPEVEPGVDIQQQALQPGFPTEVRHPKMIHAAARERLSRLMTKAPSAVTDPTV